MFRNATEGASTDQDQNHRLLITDHNATANSGCRSSDEDQSITHLTASISHAHKVHDNINIDYPINTESCEDRNFKQSSINLSNCTVEPDYLSPEDMRPDNFYESLIEEMDNNIIMLKKSLDKVLEMRVSMAELKISLKELCSSDLVHKAEELNEQLIALEENNTKFNEMILSLRHEIHPSVTEIDDANK